MVEVLEKRHATLSPSGWQTWGNCPGSVPLSEGIHVATSSYAKEGTAAHALLERCLVDKANAEDFLGESYEVEGEVFIVDNEMADAVNSAIDVINTYVDANAGAILQVEQSVPLTQMTGEEGAEGTSDVSIICEGGKHLVIVDFKYGKGVMVYASDLLPEEGAKRPNGQLAMYALGWLHKSGLIYDEIEKVTLVVLQPRLEWVDEYDVTVEQLREFEATVREAAGAVEMERLAYSGGDELTLVVGEKQCKFCSAKGICPALKASVSTALAVIAEPSKVEHFENLSLPKQAAAVAISPDVSNEKLAEFHRAIPLIEEAIKAAQGEIERRLFAGQQVPGLFLGVGRKGNRAWTNEATALKELTKSGRLKMADATQKKPISPTAAEKLLKDRPKIWSALQPFIDRADGKPKVCREGDSEEPFKIVSALEDFAPIDAPKIIVVKSAASGNALYVEASDGTHRAIPSKDCTGPIMKLARVGEPMAAPLAALPSIEVKAGAAPDGDTIAVEVEDQNPSDNAAMAALMD